MNQGHRDKSVCAFECLLESVRCMPHQLALLGCNLSVFTACAFLSMFMFCMLAKFWALHV